MEPALLGLVLDTSVLIAAERRRFNAIQTIENVQRAVGEAPIAISAVTIAEIGHGVYRASSLELRRRRRAFLDDLKATLPVYSFTQFTAEIAARVGGEQAEKGINLPFADLLIGACALELGYAVGTSNAYDFQRIPGLRLIEL